MLQQLYTFSEQTKQIFPQPNTANIRSLETWLDYSIHSLPYRKKFLDKDEIAQVEETHDAAKNLLKRLDSYLQVSLRVSTLYHLIELAEIKSNQYREAVEQEILSILSYQARTIKEGTVSVREYKQRVLVSTTEGQQFFSKQELQLIDYYVNTHLADDEYTYETFPDVSTRELARLATQRVFTFGNDWHRQSKYVNETIEKYENNPSEGFGPQLYSYRLMLENNSVLLPENLLRLGWELYYEFEKLGYHATLLDEAITEFHTKLLTLQENVTLESPLYGEKH